MRIKDLILTSLRNLSRRKVRSILTIIGVLIGSTSIIIMLSMGFGMEKTSESFMEQMGDLSTIEVYPSDSFMGELDEEQNTKGKKAILNEKTLKELEEMEGVTYALPFMESNDYGGTIIKGKSSPMGMLGAIDFSRINDYGFNLGEGELPVNRRDMLVGGDIAGSFQNLVGDNIVPVEVDLLNDRFKLRFETYDENSSEPETFDYTINITGVLQPAMDSSSYSMYIDMNYYKDIIKELDKKNKNKTDLSKYSYVRLKMEKNADFEAVQQKLKDEGYVVNSMTDYFKEIQDNIKNTKNMFLIVGAVAFVVAAIGIANTMIMSVYERTKEIGVMKVIGASIKDIRNMFLLEATFIGLIGGVLSIGFSFLVSFLLNKLGVGFGMSEFFLEDGSQVIVSYIPFWLPFVGVIFSTLVGLVSGYLPSRRATKISAIEAIRSQ